MTQSLRTAARLVWYRDLFLSWPLLLSSWIAAALLFSSSPEDKSKGQICAVIALVILTLARRRLALVLGVIAFVASRLVLSINRPTDWRISIGLFVIGLILLWGIGRLHKSRSFRRMLRDELHEFSTEEPTMADLLVNLSGLLSTLVVFYFIFGTR